MSTFPINTSIPAAGNDPADDQPEMQSNFANISGYLQVDHTNPNATGAGQHDQVTFNSNNVPSVPTALVGGNYQGITFTNTVGAGNVDHLFHYAGTATSSSNQYVANANGSTYMLGGMIIKWGTNAITNASQNFPVAFPNGAYSMVVASRDASLGSPLKVTSLSASAYTVTRSGVGNTAYYYIAIGF